MTENLKREVDAHGNCQKCGGTHYGTGWDCPMLESKPEGDLAMESEITAELPRYKCHKKVWALKIKEIQRKPSGNATVSHAIIPADEGYAPFDVSLEYIEKHNPQPGGYYVVYQDGYKSYSPAKAFEEGYTRV